MGRLEGQGSEMVPSSTLKPFCSDRGQNMGWIDGGVVGGETKMQNME